MDEAQALESARGRLPHPLALAIRQYQHEGDPTRKFQRLLDVGEKSIIWLALLSLAWANREARLAEVATPWRESLQSGGVSLGTWLQTALAAEKTMSEERVLAIPGFVEALQGRRKNRGPRGALQLLVEERNRQAHGARFRTEAETTKRLQEINPTLVELVEGIGFLGDLRWILPSRIRYDEDREDFEVSGFSLVGEHPSLQPLEIVTSAPMAEGRIYVEDSAGERTPLWPFCLASECHECYSPGIFYPSKLVEGKLQLHSFSCSHDRLDDRMWVRIKKVLSEMRDSNSRSLQNEKPSLITPKSRNWTWDDYERSSEHDASKLEIVRQLSDQIEAASGWTATKTKNQVIFKEKGEPILSIQFWARVPRIYLHRVTAEPPTDPLPQLPGRMINEGWVWDIPAKNQLPTDVAPLLALATEGYAPGGSDEPSPMSTLEAQFEAGMLAAYDVLKRFDYQASRFLMMVKDRGGLKTAEDLLSPHDQHSYGFLKLVEIQKLEWSVEAYSLRPEFRVLFEDRELDEARRRLRAANFDADRWEDSPWT